MGSTSLEIRKCEKFSDDDKHFRLQLRRWWVEPPKRWVAWLMLNPSEAGRNKPSDDTINEVMCFSHGWGFDGGIVVNVYPFVSPASGKGGELHLWRDEQEKSCQAEHHHARWFEHVTEMQDNLVEIEEAALLAARRVVGFGGNKILGKDKEWVRKCVDLFEHSSSGNEEKLKCVHFVGLNRKFPAHPCPRPWQRKNIPESSRKNPPDWNKRPKWLA